MEELGNRLSMAEMLWSLPLVAAASLIIAGGYMARRWVIALALFLRGKEE